MNDLTETEFFTLLSNHNQVSSTQFQNAYGKFTEQLKSLNRPENEYTAIYRVLNVTRIELASLSHHFRYEQGEKCT